MIDHGVSLFGRLLSKVNLFLSKGITFINFRFNNNIVLWSLLEVVEYVNKFYFDGKLITQP